MHMVHTCWYIVASESSMSGSVVEDDCLVNTGCFALGGYNCLVGFSLIFTSIINVHQ